MKNITIKSIYLVFVVATLTLVGCEDYLDQSPQDQLTEALYFKNPEQFESAANYLYTRLAHFDGDEGTDLSGNISGDLYSYGNGVVVNADDIWEDNYEHLRAPNQLIEKAAEYTGEQSDITESVGTAYFFRAWHHYLLLKRFGGVPLITSALNVNSEELYQARNSRYEVTYQIITDLDDAIQRLPSQKDLGDASQGKVTLEAAKSLKARILLNAATWEKYVGTDTDGDGTTTGAGSTKPSGYPSINDMFTSAKQAAFEVIDSEAFELWDYRTEIGDDHLFYLFNLEETSNPAGLTKADNKEFIFQTVYDFDLRNIGGNYTHTKRHTPSRKLMDMYLCTDGLPVQYSADFQGYDTMVSEYQNRDLRLVGLYTEPLREYWGWGGFINGGGAQYDVAFADSGQDFDYRYVPQLRDRGGNRGVGYSGRKFITESRFRETGQESWNYPLIRLAEVMLIYAEATVELGNGSISDTDLDFSINKIRERSGVEPLTNALIAAYSDLNMLGEIRRERAIELFAENFRYDDLKRWNIAPAELNKNVCLNYIAGTEYETAINPITNETIYVATGHPLGLTTTEQSTSTYAGIATTKPGALIFDQAGNRTFSIKNYVDPIPTDQIKLNPNLLQNPGW